MNAQPVHIRRPDPDETPLSTLERLVAVREGWRPAGAIVVVHHRGRWPTDTVHLEAVMVRSILENE